MKYIMRLYILLLTIIISYNLYSQDFKQTIDFADKQFENANYQLAVKEYQRALFFAEGNQVDYLYKQIAKAFFINKQFNQAQYFYELSYKTAKNDSVKTKMLFKKVQCLVLLHRFNSALIELYNLPDSLSDFYTNKKDFYLAISYFGLRDFKKSEKYFTKLAKNNINKHKISSLFNNKKAMYRPNPKTAKTLSKILPGLGQLYIGDLKNSLNSLSLTGGLAYLGYYLSIQYTYFDGIITVLPWFTRYYRGGYTKTYRRANKKLQNKRRKVFLQILDIIREERGND